MVSIIINWKAKTKLNTVTLWHYKYEFKQRYVYYHNVVGLRTAAPSFSLQTTYTSPTIKSKNNE